MFCKNCGNKLPKDAVFCIMCGSQVKTDYHQYNAYNPRTIPAQKPKRKKRRMIRYFAAGSVIVLLTLLIIGYISDKPGKDPKIVNVANNVSGTVNIGRAVIELPQNADDYSINIYEKEPYNDDIEDNLAFYSNIYEIEGTLDNFKQKVNVEIALADEQAELVKNAPELLNNTYIILVEEVHTPSFGTSYLERRLDSKIDIENKIITASLDLSQRDLPVPDTEAGKNIEHGSIMNDALSKLDSLIFTKAYADNGETINDEDQKSSFGFQVKSYKCFWEQVLSDDKSFRIVYDADEVQKDCVPILLEDLQWSKTFLEGLGFSFDSVSKPIYVEIKDLDGKIGEYKGSKFLRSNDALYIDKSNFIMNAKGYEKLKRQEVKITAAHELFHLVQSYYNPQTRLKQNHPWASKPFVWLEEAASTWIEPKIAGEGYVPDNAAKNISFINSPLAFTQSGEHGYGASIFLKYIEGKTDKESVFNTFFYAKLNSGLITSVPAGASISAFNKVMREIYQESPEELWIDFVKTYYLEPKSIYPWLDTSSLKNNGIYLKAKSIPIDDKKSDVEFEFETNVSNPTQITNTSKGKYLAKTHAKVQLSRKLENLSADWINIGFSEECPAFNWKGAKLKVSVNTTGKTGVMIYDSKKNKIAGALWNFLSSSADDERFKGSSTITIEDFKIGGTGYITLIPFNFHTSEELSSGSIDVTVEYIPGKRPDDPPEPDEPEPKEPVIDTEPAQPQQSQADKAEYSYRDVAGTYVDTYSYMTETTVLGADGSYRYTWYEDENLLANWIGTYEIVYPDGGFAEGDEVPLFYIEVSFHDTLDDCGVEEWTHRIYERYVKNGRLMQLGGQKRVD